MPLFFDLGLPYSSGGANAAAQRDTRLRSTVKLLELGYSGAAYNVFLRSVFSDKDRCTIAPFPLSSLLAAAPSLGASASFHRKLLGYGGDAGPAFRQFSRVTVSVETVNQAGSVGSTNAVLRGYDIVAIRPLSQSAFDHACKCSEVDLISIDFSTKLPFRLRHQSVELAIKRGLYFEITYSQLLNENPNIKRQMIFDAKLLVDWTKGKNIIVTSSAFNANEIRGPNDISNLISFLLGFSKQRANSASSDNCRALLAKALRKKHFHKETISIERIPKNKLDLENRFSIGDWINWDSIYSGDGDLPSLEEISKISSSNPNDNNSKAIDFESIVEEKPFFLGQQDKNEIVNYDLMQLDENKDDFFFKKCEFGNDQIALESKENVEEIKILERENIIENESEKDHNTLDSNKNLEESKMDEIMENNLVNYSIETEEVKEMNSEVEREREDEIIEFRDENLEREDAKENNLLIMDENVNSENNEGLINNNILSNNLMDEDSKSKREKDEAVRDEKDNENENNEGAIGKIDNTDEPSISNSIINNNNSFLDNVLTDLGNNKEDRESSTSKQGKRKNKNRMHKTVYALPFKKILKPMLFKKKRRNKLQ